MKAEDPFVSIVVPLYNERESVAELHQELQTALGAGSQSPEFAALERQLGAFDFKAAAASLQRLIEAGSGLA